MTLSDILRTNIEAIGSYEDDIEKYAQYWYCLGSIETMLMLGELSSDNFQYYSQLIRDKFDALSYVMKIRGIN